MRFKVWYEFASWQLLVSRSSTIVFSIYLLLKTNLMPWKTPLCIYLYIAFWSQQCDSACSWRWVVVNTDHLNISFVWKSMVSSCVCVWLKFKRSFSTCWSPAQNAFVSSAKCSSPGQHKTCSFLAINEFVCNVISCLEESSIGYLVTSDDAFVCSVISYFEVKWAVFENWFTNPCQKNRHLGEKFLKKNWFGVGTELKNV